MILPDPLRFDPVRFPGVGEDEPWPPPAFDFRAPWLATPDLAFERGASGQIVFVRRCESLRLVLDIETAHSALDVVPGSRDFRLLRLVPAALRFTEVVTPGGEVPPPLHGQPLLLPAEHHLYAATSALAAALERGAGEAGEAFLDALRRTPPGEAMFEMAAARCVALGGFGLDGVARLARALQRLARAHAEVLAAHAVQPDWAGMERMVAATTRVLVRDSGWSGDLIAVAIRHLGGVIATPRLTAEALLRAARAPLEQPGSLERLERLTLDQARLRDRLCDLALFWSRCCAAWCSIHPETSERRAVEALGRNAMRRLSLAPLYAPP
ncbi:hypothetical protein ACI6QG_02555 [Roseococcus sp. DSY-14]|uniref:hypothetical protein n=1 Tax=Roseococcus sp. DSY-14 TaxID=3369650 RepID=UPI00387B97AA